MQKYAGFSKTQFPNFGQYESWAGADLMIKGLQMAGPNPTRATVIEKLRGIKSYNVNGVAVRHPRLLDEFRAQPRPDLRLDHEGRSDRVHRDLLEALVWEGPRRDLDRKLTASAAGMARKAIPTSRSVFSTNRR